MSLIWKRVHRVEHRLFDDHPQAARPNLPFERRFGDRLERIVIKAIAFENSCCELVVPRGPPFQERSQLAAARRVAQLPERLGLDLPYTLARDREVLSYFFQRVLAAVAVADPKTHLDDALLARRQGLQDRLDLLLQVQVDHRLGGRDCLAILNEIA